MLDNRKVIIDIDCKIADTGGSAGLIYADAAATVDAVATYFDTGGGYTDGMFVVDIEAINSASASTNHRAIKIVLEGSNTTTFTSYVPLAYLGCDGSAATAPAPDNRCNVSCCNVLTTSTGRFMAPFHNDFFGTVYRYLRVYSYFMGTAEASGGTSIAFKAYLSKR